MIPLMCQVPFGAGAMALNLNPAIWEAIAATVLGRNDLADMGRSSAAPVHILWWRIGL